MPTESNSGDSSPTKVLPGLRSSSYRYIAGKPLHPSQHFEDIKNLNYGLSSESNVLEANKHFLAFPVTGPGGRVVVWKVNEPGRLPPVPASFISGSEISDFCLSQLQPDLLLTASEDARLRLFKIPENGLKQDESKPLATLSGHMSRVHHVQFHPFAQDVALSCQNSVLKIWDLNQLQWKQEISDFGDQIQSCQFQTVQPGLLLTSCKDKQLRLFDPRTLKAVLSTVGHEGVRASRAFWLDTDYFCSVGFGKGSQREILLFDKKNAFVPLQSLSLGVSPSIFVPHYDEDSKIVYLSGKGETGILPVEITPQQSSAFYELPRFDSPNASIQQGVCFLPKKYLSVDQIEVARCWRLTQTSIEPISFSVPRNRKEYFQDDLFPLCWDREQSTMNSQQWFSESEIEYPKRNVDLCPEKMIRLSNAPPEKKAPPKYSLSKGPRELTDSEKQKQFLNGLFKNAKGEEEEREEVLPQEQLEGCDSDEWDDY